jgi:integrase
MIMSIPGFEAIDTEALSENTKRALASLALEGISPSPQLLADLKLVDSGQLTEDEFLARAIVRAKSPPTLEDINTESILAFLGQIEKERKNSIATRNISLAALKIFCLYLSTKDISRIGEYQKIMSIPAKRAPRKIIDYLEINELEAIFKSIDCKERAGNEIMSYLNYYIIQVLGCKRFVI